MFNLFSAISGKFSTSIVTGTFFPVLLFLSCFVWIVQPVAPGIVVVPTLFRTLETQSLVLAITFALSLLTGILSGINHLLIRYYANARIPGAARFHADRVERLRFLRDELDRLGSGATGTQLAQANDAINPILTVLAEEYPADGSPSATRLGNVLANREGYFKQRYGISHAVGWWRLAGAIDPTFAGLLDDSKASFDFMLNSSFLALLTLAALLGYAVCFGAEPWPFGWRVALFALTSRLAYLGAVDRAKAMGYLERAAIDLFRLSLLSKLGFKYDFLSLADERAVWASLEVSLTTPDRSDGPPYHPAPMMPIAPTSAASEQGALTVLRSIRTLRPARYPSAEIELAISDPQGKAHTQVQVTDATMPSWFYVTGSAVSSGGALMVTSTDPFSAALGPLAAGAVITVTYRCQAWKAGS